MLEFFGASTRNHQEATMSVTTSERTTSATAVRPVTVEVPQAEIEALRAGSQDEVDKGGHFAAWEQLELFTEEFRAAFPSLR